MANPNKVGLVFAAAIGARHLIWAVLVLLGWAQLIIDFIFWAHMIQPVYVIKPFNSTAAVTLIIVTAAAGYGAVIWNKLHRAH